MGAILDSGRTLDYDVTPMPLSACTFALWAGLGDNPTLAVALAANSGINEVAKEASLDSAYLSGAIAVRALAGLTAWLGAKTMA